MWYLDISITKQFGHVLFICVYYYLLAVNALTTTGPLYTTFEELKYTLCTYGDYYYLIQFCLSYTEWIMYPKAILQWIVHSRSHFVKWILVNIFLFYLYIFNNWGNWSCHNCLIFKQFKLSLVNKSGRCLYLIYLNGKDQPVDWICPLGRT